MKLEAINWAEITQAQAGRLLGAARQREQAAARKWDASDSDEDKAAWDVALELEENLLVFARCGERPGA